MESHPGTERVTQQITGGVADGGPDGLGHQRGGRRKIGPHRVRAGMTGQVDADQRVVLRHQIAEGTPQAGGLGESVEKDQGWPGPTHLDMERHG